MLLDIHFNPISQICLFLSVFAISNSDLNLDTEAECELVCNIDRAKYDMLIVNLKNTCIFNNSYWVTIHWNRLFNTILMSANSIGFWEACIPYWAKELTLPSVGLYVSDSARYAQGCSDTYESIQWIFIVFPNKIKFLCVNLHVESTSLYRKAHSTMLVSANVKVNTSIVQKSWISVYTTVVFVSVYLYSWYADIVGLPGAVFIKLLRKVSNLNEKLKCRFLFFYQHYFNETLHAYEKRKHRIS